MAEPASPWVLAGITLLVGLACLCEFGQVSPAYRDRRMFRPLLWCLGFTLASIPYMTVAVIIAGLIYL
jgi:hypothetical protein